MKNSLNRWRIEKGYVEVKPMFWGMAFLAIGFTLFPLIGLWGLMMVWGVSLAFLWLMIESKWLTIRLPQYYRERLAIEDLAELIPLVVMIGFICMAILKLPGGKKPEGANLRQRLKTWLNPREWLSFLFGVIVILEWRYSEWKRKREKTLAK